MNKILFLDIDGVLNSSRSCFAHGGYPHGLTPEHLEKFDHCAVALVRRACDETGARIILSSTWRKLHAYAEIGAALNLPIIGATPEGGHIVAPGGTVFEFSHCRGAEIKAWMDANYIPDRYAILDDDSDMLEEQMPCFVRVDGECGLQLAHYKRLLELL